MSMTGCARIAFGRTFTNINPFEHESGRSDIWKVPAPHEPSRDITRPGKKTR
jgi:hypothetical protein